MLSSFKQLLPAKRSLTARLTAWYLLLLSCTLIIFSGYLYLQLRSSLLGQLDTTLKVASTEILTNLVVEGDRISFSDTEQFWSNQQQLTRAGFSARIIASNGNISDGFGNYKAIKILLPQTKGYQKLKVRNQNWRTYNLPLAIADSQIVEATPDNSDQQWLQLAQSLQPMTDALEHLLTLMLFGFPLILLLASLGGLFLADRALRPINQIIRTAEAINSDDLSYRINYQGKSDEVGRLAMTLDRMLNRIELAFEHERRFIADASHELRTPLTIIKGKIGVALSRQRTTTEYETTLQDLDSQTDRLIRLTNGLLFLARLEREQSELEGRSFTELDLTSLLEVLSEQIQLTADKQLQITAAILPNLLVFGDGDLLTSLFLNLLDNAVKYTPAGGAIHLKTTLDRQQVTVTISNTGSGIAAEDLPYLFDRFYRSDCDRASGKRGSGLGLAIAALIARCHGGQISVTSQIDKLTTFEVDLPTLTDK